MTSITLPQIAISTFYAFGALILLLWAIGVMRYNWWRREAEDVFHRFGDIRDEKYARARRMARSTTITLAGWVLTGISSGYFYLLLPA